ncbi:MAG TPA: SAM-dependent methyltransferase, partial [Trebonia sp.]|nr:SAM-dependent methyltransferase [Trebonia sp.]
AAAAEARQVAATFSRALAPGSYLVISVGSGDPSEGENFTSAYTAARIFIHSADEIASFFDGLRLVPPGIVAVRSWHGDELMPPAAARTATFLCGVARKP